MAEAGTAQAARVSARADTLMESVRTVEGRAERLYAHAEAILERALEVKDHRTALQAIGAALHVMREKRSYLELRAELTGELNQPQQQPHQQMNIWKAELGGQ